MFLIKAIVRIIGGTNESPLTATWYFDKWSISVKKLYNIFSSVVIQCFCTNFKDRVGASAIFRLSRALDAIAAHAQQKQPIDIQIVNIIKSIQSTTLIWTIFLRTFCLRFLYGVLLCMSPHISFLLSGTLLIWVYSQIYIKEHLSLMSF